MSPQSKKNTLTVLCNVFQRVNERSNQMIDYIGIQCVILESKDMLLLGESEFGVEFENTTFY